MSASPTGGMGGLSRVVSGGYCIGCGACAAARGSPIRMRMNEVGCYEPTQGVLAEPGTDLSAVCPFSGSGESETEIAAACFPGGAPDNKIGPHVALFAGFVAEDRYRPEGSSGGMATWLLVELLRRDMVDGVVHVLPRTPTPADPRLFSYGISTDEEGIRRGAKSRYYPVEFSVALKRVREEPGRYAVVGVPCFIKAVRLLQQSDPVFAERIRYGVAIFCGHLKSTAYAEYLAWQCGVRPAELGAIDFRFKFDEGRGIDYGVEVRGRGPSDRPVVRAMAGLDGADWGAGYFKYSACDYCDDVVGETADVSVGDAWIRPYVEDCRGNNVVVVRNSSILPLLEEAREAGRLQLDAITPEAVVASQRGGFRHRRDGLAYRLWLKQKAGAWAPQKRVSPENRHLSRREQRVFEFRIRLREVSHHAFLEAKQRNDIAVFSGHLGVLMKRYERLQRGGMRALLQRIAGRVGRAVRRRRHEGR